MPYQRVPSQGQKLRGALCQAELAVPSLADMRADCAKGSKACYFLSLLLGAFGAVVPHIR